MILAIDTETHLFGNGNMAPRIVCVSFATSGTEATVLSRDDARQPLAEALLAAARGELIIVGQNFAYDAACLMATYGDEIASLLWSAYDAGAIQDTKIRERLLDIAAGETGPHTRQPTYYSLGTLVERHKLMRLDKSGDSWRLRYSELDDVLIGSWPAEAIAYAVDDARATWLLHDHQSRRAYDGFEPEAARQASFALPLHLMTCWGVRTDAAAVRELDEKTTARIAELTATLLADKLLVVKGEKVSKPLTEIRRRIEASGVEVTRTPTGLVKTDAKTMRKTGDTGLVLLVEFDSLRKLKSTYIEKLWQGVEGTIHASFHVLGADTGRTSSSNPNLQNQPKGWAVRECFVPREGFVFLSADYDTQELRTLAQACLDMVGHSRLARSFQDDPDFDPHADFAARLLGITYDEAMQLKHSGDAEFKTWRQRAKAANFGFPGGLGAKRFREYAEGYGLDLKLSESEKLRAQWFEQWPEMGAYFESVNQIARGSGVAVQLRSGRRRGGVGFTDGANTFFQGLASEASKSAVYAVSRACYAEPASPLFGSRPWALVHDEIVLETPEGQGSEAARELQRLMVAAMERWCPDVPARATPVLARRWSKRAESSWENGELSVWEDGE